MFPKRQPMTDLSSNSKTRERTNALTNWYQRVRSHDLIVAVDRLEDIGRRVCSHQRSQGCTPKLCLPGDLGLGAGTMEQGNNDRRRQGGRYGKWSGHDGVRGPQEVQGRGERGLALILLVSLGGGVGRRRPCNPFCKTRFGPCLGRVSAYGSTRLKNWPTMGRSKRLNAWKGSTKGERQVDRDSRNGLGVKQSGRLVYDDDARGRGRTSQSDTLG